MSRAATGIGPSLDALRATTGIVAGLRLAETLAHAASMEVDADRTLHALGDVVRGDGADGGDQLLAIAAVHAISAIRGRAASSTLRDLLGDRRWPVAEHASWAMSARSPHRPAMDRLAAMVATGGFGGMLAQRTLGGWATGDAEGVHTAIGRALAEAGTDARRARLVETLGLVPGRTVTAALERVAADHGEGTGARGAAIAALGDRHEPADHADIDLLVALTGADDHLAELALLALVDAGRAGLVAGRRGNRTGGLRVAQLFLHADLESGGRRAGAGDNGGIATLLGLLSAEMSARPEVELVTTIGRGMPADVLASEWAPPGDRERFAAVTFGPMARGQARSVDPRAAWPHRVEIERGIRRVLQAVAPVDVLHLRMADVGTLAASRVARALGVPVVFTAAPDPHVVLRSLEAEGSLDRTNFGDSDALEHWWFRARMVERMAAHADRVALLPRPGMDDELRELLGYVPDRRRDVVIPEGVHAATVRRAAADAERASTPDQLGAAVSDLCAALAALPPERRDLPLVVTVGRLHPMKGLDRVVAAWASCPDLVAGTNLVIVGGDLAAPSPDELDVLSAIDDVLAAGVPGGGADGVIMLGHRPHGEVAALLAVAAGTSSLAPGGGIYVGGARKEEFGLAIVEALAAGLPVVAPAGGGPATYVDDGVTGVLVDTSSVAALADGMRRALRLAAVPGRAAAASEQVLADLTIERMADRLVELYGAMTSVDA